MIAVAEHRRRDIGLNPESSASVEPESIRAGKQVAVDVALEVFRRQGRIAAFDEDIPGEGRCRGVTATLAPAQDVSEKV